MTTELKTIQTTILQCNCPECYSNSGLELSFKQEWKDTFWVKKATDVMREEIYCKHCEFPIYPVKWTEDIERLYEYNLKRAEKETFFKVKSQTYMIGAIAVAVVAIVVYALVSSL